MITNHGNQPDLIGGLGAYAINNTLSDNPCIYIITNKYRIECYQSEVIAEKV